MTYYLVEDVESGLMMVIIAGSDVVEAYEIARIIVRKQTGEELDGQEVLVTPIEVGVAYR